MFRARLALWIACLLIVQSVALAWNAPSSKRNTPLPVQQTQSAKPCHHAKAPNAVEAKQSKQDPSNHDCCDDSDQACKTHCEMARGVCSLTLTANTLAVQKTTQLRVDAWVRAHWIQQQNAPPTPPPNLI